ncbi:unnamed protein product [Trypanosoma congolense IL3000]|uniref:WGS project CAEQ00000000 data, annotated contig 1271 n=1 Tax=Trypanosoma congolense (strain IL3000) TaxID=1068625 RepID=F9W537_TRYCI|nr:unnamed protein product [Trypanosoma congolense IL3000]
MLQCLSPICSTLATHLIIATFVALNLGAANDNDCGLQHKAVEVLCNLAASVRRTEEIFEKLQNEDEKKLLGELMIYKEQLKDKVWEVNEMLRSRGLYHINEEERERLEKICNEAEERGEEQYKLAKRVTTLFSNISKEIRGAALEALGEKFHIITCVNAKGLLSILDCAVNGNKPRPGGTSNLENICKNHKILSMLTSEATARRDLCQQVGNQNICLPDTAEEIKSALMDWEKMKEDGVYIKRGVACVLNESWRPILEAVVTKINNLKDMRNVLMNATSNSAGYLNIVYKIKESIKSKLAFKQIIESASKAGKKGVKLAAEAVSSEWRKSVTVMMTLISDTELNFYEGDAESRAKPMSTTALYVLIAGLALFLVLVVLLIYCCCCRRKASG